MANFQMGGNQDDGEYNGPYDGSLRHCAKKAANLSLPGASGILTRSLFIFSEENFIRKYAKIIIEWGYPFSRSMFIELVSFCMSCNNVVAIYGNKSETSNVCGLCTYSHAFKILW